MKKFYLHAIMFWFVLLLLALINATIRETTYKPFLTPYIGTWAHQLSSLTGTLLFFCGIYIFIGRNKGKYTAHDLTVIGVLWIGMTIGFETAMNTYIRHLSFEQVIQTYYFWKGDTWIFVLLSLIISPHVVDKMLNKKN